MQAGIVAAALLNADPNIKKEDFLATDFLLEFEDAAEPKPVMTPDEIGNKLRQYFMIRNANREMKRKRGELPELPETPGAGEGAS